MQRQRLETASATLELGALGNGSLGRCYWDKRSLGPWQTGITGCMDWATQEGSHTYQLGLWTDGKNEGRSSTFILPCSIRISYIY